MACARELTSWGSALWRASKVFFHFRLSDADSMTSPGKVPLGLGCTRSCDAGLLTIAGEKGTRQRWWVAQALRCDWPNFHSKVNREAMLRLGRKMP